MRHLSALTGASLLALAGQTAVAQIAFELDEITFSANRTPTARASAGATVTVITGDEIRASGEARVIDYIARMPGVGVLARGPVGALSSITIRGASRNYVQVLVDGIDVTDPSGPQVAFDFGQLLTDDVSRIEILRGAQSALYGSSAIGGVVSITTARAEEEGFTQTVAAEAGTYSTLRGSYGLAFRQGDTDLALTISGIETDGFSAADEADGNTEDDGYSATRLSFSGGTRLQNGVELGLSGFLQDGEGEYDEQFPVGDGSPDELTRAETWGLRGFIRFDSGAIRNELALTGFRIERNDTGSTVFGPFDVTYAGERTGLSYQGDMVLGGGELSFGGSLNRESYDQSGSFGPGGGDNTVAAVFAEYALAATQTLDLTGTVRLDSHSEFGEFATGRLAGAWRVRPDVIVRSSLANGFRAPSNYELFGPFVGNPDLEAEESLSFDLGVEKLFGDTGMISATLFYNETDNLIDYDGASYIQIPGTVIRRGLELEASHAISDRLTLSGNYTFTDDKTPAISAGNTWNTSFGKHDLSIALDAAITDRLRGVFTVQHVADRQSLPDYTLANVMLTQEINDSAEAYLRIENLTDEQYQLIEGYGTSGRAFYAGFRARF